MDLDLDVGSEANEDSFFADIKRRILLLTADEDDGLDGLERKCQAPSTINVSPESFPMCWNHVNMESSLWNGNALGIPPLLTHDPKMLNIWSWELSREECKGTGVFIPSLPKPRRKSKAGRTGFTKKIKPL